MPKYQDKERAEPYSSEYQKWRAAKLREDEHAARRAEMEHRSKFNPKYAVINGVRLGPIHD